MHEFSNVLINMPMLREQPSHHQFVRVRVRTRMLKQLRRVIGRGHVLAKIGAAMATPAAPVPYV